MARDQNLAWSAPAEVVASQMPELNPIGMIGASGCRNIICSSLGLESGMAPIIADFVRDLPAQVNQLKFMLEHQQLEPLRCLVHQLRGACGGYGFEAITDIAAAAENAIKTGQRQAAISTGIESLIEVIQRIQGYDGAERRMAA